MAENNNLKDNFIETEEVITYEDEHMKVIEKIYYADTLEDPTNTSASGRTIKNVGEDASETRDVVIGEDILAAGGNSNIETEWSMVTKLAEVYL